MSVSRLPSIFRRPPVEPVATDDPRISAVIRVQQALLGLRDDECEFVIEMVQRNLELTRRNGARYAFEDES